MIRSAIRLIAAALCGTKKEVVFKIAPVPGLQPVLDFLLMLSAYPEVSRSGEARVRPVLRLPIDLGFRFDRLPKELFELLAGAASKMNVSLRVAEVTPPVTAEEMDACVAALDGILFYVINDNRVALSAFSLSEGISDGADVSPAFVAGAMLGTVLGLRDAEFRLGSYAGTEPVKAAVEAIREFGGVLTEEGDSVTVHTVRYERFQQKNGRRMRPKKSE